MANDVRVWVRVLVAVSVLWILLAAGAIFVEYLSRNPLDQFPNSRVPPEFYFWQWSGLDVFAPKPENQVRTFEPISLRILSFLFGPLLLIWVIGPLIVWVKNGFRSSR